ncbi:cytochrome b [Cellvibrio zantedeschiae]|uniref:Cytochrome b n=1 Tax=Cellvibrio zantedeschiae TaxID=1237077 RepID=A0ABQ3B8A7_9GAMM|nr:cytochrome b [Cellvibrio zantedeschiae]GGY79766.1 cytochrome b [Cellvibrio zantedeschiae]
MVETAKLSRITIALHWLVAIGFVSLCVMGIYIVKAEAWTWYWTHKSLGVILFMIIVARAWWRLVQGWPAPINTYDKVEQKISKFVHWGLLAGTMFIPISGMIHSSASGHGFGIFAWHIVADNPALDPKDGVIAYSSFWASFGQLTHKWVAYCLLCMIVLHVAGALKHHVVYKDKTLLRMLGK